jgi:DNA-binding transcriptional regulator LsrR (DeoR family)
VEPENIKLTDPMYQKTILAAELYYTYHLTQQEIAKKLGVSRPWVSKLLKRAEDIGIVRIEVLTPTAGILELENKLKKRYSLVNARVIKQTIETDNDIIHLARAAANYLISVLKSNDIIGVSWGKTLAMMAQQLIPLHYPGIMVVPLLGGMGQDPELLSNQIASKIALALNGKCFLLHAPAFTVGLAERDVFLSDPIIKNTIKKGEQTTVAIFGLGSLWKSTILQRGYITLSEIKELAELGAVGDIALRFINKDGEIIPHDIHKRLVASDLNKVKNNAREVIGVAGGLHKVDVIRAALNGKWLDVLITDVRTAEKLL